MMRQEEDFLMRVCQGNTEAALFLRQWGNYLRLVDDAIDEDKWDADHVMAAFAAGLAMYSSAFYQRNKAFLQMPILLATNIYADSVVWEKAPERWKRQWADVMRHADGHVVSAVTLICGGWNSLREISAPFMAACYIDHKDRHGVP